MTSFFGHTPLCCLVETVLTVPDHMTLMLVTLYQPSNFIESFNKALVEDESSLWDGTSLLGII